MSLGAKAEFRAMLGALEGPFWASKNKKICLESHLKINVNSELYFMPSGGRFGLDFGALWGSILGPRARPAILAKNSTAPRREHDF